MKNKIITLKRYICGKEEFNFILDLENFNYEVELYNLQASKDMFIEGMNKAIITLKTLLRVKPPRYNYIFTDEQIRSINIYYWVNIGCILTIIHTWSVTQNVNLRINYLYID